MIVLCLLVTSGSLSAQTDHEKSSKYDTIEMQVKGVCTMCQTRIELAAYDLKGVKSAEWDLESEKLTVIAKKGKVTEQSVAEALAMKGHASEHMPADSLAYQGLPDCCKYADGVPKHNDKK